jgi:hypothetical protein
LKRFKNSAISFTSTASAVKGIVIVSFYGLVDGTEASLKSYLNNLSGVDQIGADARAAMLATRSIKTSSKRWAIDTAITMVDRNNS